MPKFKITVNHWVGETIDRISTWEVEAESKEAAYEAFLDGDGKEMAVVSNECENVRGLETEEI